MKQNQIKVNVGKRGDHDEVHMDQTDEELREVLLRLKKKGLNPMQMCQKLTEHEVPPPGSDVWSYDTVVEQCKKLKIG